MTNREKEEPKDKSVRAHVLRILRERVKDPTLGLDTVAMIPSRPETVAVYQLIDAGYVTNLGYITLAGADYYRRETANPVLTWLRSNWFAVIVAGCTIGVSVWGIVSG